MEKSEEMIHDVCQLCHLAYFNTSDPLKHELQHFNQSCKDYKCLICSKLLHNAGDILLHYSANHPIVKHISCTICTDKFENGIKLRSHLRSHHEYRSSLCRHCHKYFKTVHKLHHHQENACDKKTIRTQLKERNLNINHLYYCEICEKKFSSVALLMIHNQLHNASYKCKVCKERFSKRLHLSQHMQIHRIKRDYICTICGESFKSKKILFEHGLIHDDNSEYSCYVCSKTFQLRNILKEHLRTHVPNERFECKQCNKRFKHSLQLKVHLNSHKTEKTFACNICAKRFTTKGNCNNHEKRHKNL